MLEANDTYIQRKQKGVGNEEEEEEEEEILTLDRHLTIVNPRQNRYTPNDSKMGNPITSGPSLLL